MIIYRAYKYGKEITPDGGYPFEEYAQMLDCDTIEKVYVDESGNESVIEVIEND